MTGIIVSTPPTVEVPPGNNAANPSSLPPVTYAYAVLNLPQTWGAKQTFPLGNISLNAADITGLAASATIDTTNASNITSGTLPAAQLPNPTASTLGGIQSLAAVGSKWINAISTSGVASATRPTFPDISGNISITQMNSGTAASSSTFWRGDGTWATPSATAGVASLNGQTGALALRIQPQGRLTLTSGAPVMATGVAAATTIYYSAYAGDQVPLYDGTNMVPTAITGGEISVATTDATKSPAAIGASKVNDWFIWNDSGTIRISHGPDWTNDTTRSAGTALVLVNGIWLNNASITNGPAASRGTYVGTTRSNGGSSLDYILGGLATNGLAAVLNVWNAYNRIDVSVMVGMTNATPWTYSVANTWRQANAQTSNSIQFVRGLNEDGISAVYAAQANAATSNNAAVGIGLDSTTAVSGRPTYTQQSLPIALSAYYDGIPGLGVHTLYPIELVTSTGANQYYGNPAAYIQTGLSARMKA